MIPTPNGPSSLASRLRDEMRENLRDPLPNVLAGVTVAVVALPLALAFGLIAFGPEHGPAAGIWSAVIAGAIAALLGGAPYAITGPTGVLAVFIASLVAVHGGVGNPDALAFAVWAVALSGVVQVLLGVLRLGRVIEFVPYPVVTGFMNGIALIILWSGLEELFTVPGVTGDGLASALGAAAGGAAPPAVYGGIALAGVCLAVILAWPPLVRRVPRPGLAHGLARVPGSLVALVALTLASVTLPAFSAVRRLDALPGGLPRLVLDVGGPWGLVPGVLVRHPEWTLDLVAGAVGLALVSSMDTLLTCVMADGATGTRHRPSRELVAQGVANAVAGAFGANQACGAAVRTMVNVKNGGRTRLSGVTHAVTLLLLLFVGAGLATAVPLAVLSGILFATAFGMVEWRALLAAHRAPLSDTAVMILTTGITVYAGLIEAVVAGVFLAAVLLVRRLIILGDVVVEPEWTGTPRDGLEEVGGRVLVYDVRGPLFFGVASRFTTTFTRADLKAARVVVFRMNAVTTIDETSMRALDVIRDRLAANGQVVVLSHVPDATRRRLDRYGLTARLGPDNVAPTLAAALDRARVLLEDAEAPELPPAAAEHRPDVP